MKNFKQIFFTTATILLLFSCSSKQKQIVGMWQAISRDGKAIDNDNGGHVITFNEDGTVDFSGETAKGKWKFSDDKSSVITTSGDTSDKKEMILKDLKFSDNKMAFILEGSNMIFQRKTSSLDAPISNKSSNTSASSANSDVDDYLADLEKFVLKWDNISQTRSLKEYEVTEFTEGELKFVTRKNELTKNLEEMTKDQQQKYNQLLSTEAGIMIESESHNKN